MITLTITVGLLGLQVGHPLVPLVALALILVELVVVLVLAVVTPEDQEVARVVRLAHQVEVTQVDQTVVVVPEEVLEHQVVILTEEQRVVRLKALEELALLGELQRIQQQHLEENQKALETPVVEEVVVINQNKSKKK
jgi:hypothetical protein